MASSATKATIKPSTHSNEPVISAGRSNESSSTHEQKRYDDYIYMSFLTLLETPMHTPRNLSKGEISDGMEALSKAHKKLRKLILKKTIPEIAGKSSLRPWIWKVLLKVESLDVNDYLRWVDMGPSEVSTKIKNDTFRTLATDTQFKGRVKEEMLIRLLEAFIWKHHDSGNDELPFSYVQGMNVLSAPFLYVMPSQVEAFACFSTFIEVCCPLYVQPTLVGVHRGLRLLDKCLQFVDKDLFEYLRSKNLTAELYAFPSVLTLCACTPPLNEVLRLWDFLLAFGVHLNVLCVVAQVLVMKVEILEAPSPMKILRTFPPLEAQNIIDNAVLLARMIPEDLYEELVKHPFAAGEYDARGSTDRRDIRK